NYLVVADGIKVVVRIPGRRTDLLAIDRANERYNAEAAATTGVSPPILVYLEDRNVMVLPFIEGRTMSAAALRSAEQTGRIAASLRRLHAAPRFLQDFDMFQTIEYYRTIVGRHDVQIPHT